MISENDVKYVASLARVHLRHEEVNSLTKDLEQILHYIKKLDSLDVKAVEPTCHVMPLKNVHRQDVVIPSLTQSEALEISVEKYNASFKVPKVIE